MRVVLGLIVGPEATASGFGTTPSMERLHQKAEALVSSMGHTHIPHLDIDARDRLERAGTLPPEPDAFAWIVHDHAGVLAEPLTWAATENPGGGWTVVYAFDEIEDHVATKSLDEDGALALLQMFLDRAAATSATAHQIRLAVEEFIDIWQRSEIETVLDKFSERTADALIHMMAEVIKDLEPPKGVLREAAGWFGHKIDVFADQFASAAGKALGTAAGVGAGATISGHLPELTSALDKLRAALGR